MKLIMHAALCDHCGTWLRAATSVDDDPTPQEEKLMAEHEGAVSAQISPLKRVPPPPHLGVDEVAVPSSSVDRDCGGWYATTVITHALSAAEVCELRR